MSIYDPSLFRAYDIRGTYPSQINEKLAYAAGQAFVTVMQAKRVVVGRDVRASGVSLQKAVIQGILDAGADAIDLGVISTEMLYFASATLDCDGGLSVTASHNPPQWNGIKSIGKGAIPLTREDKLGEIYEFINSGRSLSQLIKGALETKNLLPDYIAYLQKCIPSNLKGTKLVANPNFGANGKIVDALTKDLPLDIVRLNWQEDGTFPKGTPDPMLPHNRLEIAEVIKKRGADFGAAWDADADRCFFYDEKGRFFHGYYVTALLIKHILELEPGSNVIGERRLIWANQDAAKNGGGTLVFSRTGHGYMKKSMRENKAIVGGEMSGHYYYRDFFNCDNGLVTFLTVLGIFNRQLSEGKKISELLDWYLENYPISQQEMNYTTDKASQIMEDLSNIYQDAAQDKADGLSVEYPNWRFNIRMSDNEPVARLNMEARTPEELTNHLEEIQQFLAKEGAILRDDNH